jgi:hypothetical protein
LVVAPVESRPRGKERQKRVVSSAAVRLSPRVEDIVDRVRELERLLGRKIMEVEILKEALDVGG